MVETYAENHQHPVQASMLKNDHHLDTLAPPSPSGVTSDRHLG